MKPTLSCFFALVLAAIGYGAVHPNPASPRFTAKELRQGYRDHVILAKPRALHRATVADTEARAGVQTRETLPHLGDLRIIDLPASDSADAAIERLRATGNYEFVEPDYLRAPLVSPNDTRFLDGSLWGLHNTGQTGGNIIGVADADIDAPEAWDIIREAPNVIVAVVDTGINLTHQDLVPNLWTNPNPTNGDLHGANFVGGRGSFVSGDPTDDDGHGTHVAGTIGAVGNNGTGVTGVAWRVKLMGVKVFPANANGSVSEIAAGVNYAIAKGAHIINASYGGEANTGFSQTELTAIRSARDKGILFVAAAGNASSNMDISRFYPASHALDNVVTVGASTRRDEIATTFSNFGGAIDLYAPGEEIVSLDHASNTGVRSLSGTSMAAPHVSGALALLMAHFPADNYRQLINRLLRGVDRGDRFIGRTQSNGRLNLQRALTTTTNRPFNDDFADRPRFNTDNLALRTSTAGATAEAGEPAVNGIPASSSLWWEWTAPATGVVTVNTSGSSYDTAIAVYTGTALNALTPIATNDNDGMLTTSRVTFTAQGGTTYQICVDGRNGTAGLTLLNVGTIPSNDAFATPVTLTGESPQVVATNANTSREAGEPRIENQSGGTSLWYRWTAPRSGRFQISAFSDDFDPLLAVYTGSALTALTLLDASDDASPRCTIQAVAGTTYLITVDSKVSTAVGEFTLSIVDSLWQAATGQGITMSPAVASDGTIYVGSLDRSVYAYAPDGTLKWTVATGGTLDSASAAVAEDGTVYIGSNDGTLYALNPNGTEKWRRNFTANGAPAQASSSPAIAADGTIYIRISDGFLHALNPTDGTDRWTANINTTAPTFYGNPVIGPDGTIYQGSDETDAKLYAFSPSGSAQWTKELNSGVYGAPAIDAEGNLYVVTLTGGVYSFTPAGTQRWAVTSGGNISSSVALSADGKTLYYAGYDAKLYARETATGAQQWAFTLGNEVRASSPAVDGDGVIYIGAYDGKLYAVNPDGTLKRTYAMAEIVRSGPAIAGDRLYVGCSDFKLYAFALPAGAGQGAWPQYRANARRVGRAVTETFGISAHPRSQAAVLGLPLSLGVSATGAGTLTYQWFKDGVALTGATASTYTVSTVTAGTAGSYTVTVTGTQGSLTSNAAVITVEPITPGRLMNLSVRTGAGTGAQTLTVGFAISGSAGKQLLIRGIGPSLMQFGIGDALAAPRVGVIAMNSGAEIASNTGWGGSTSLAAAFDRVGAFGLAANSLDSALLTTLSPAVETSYSVQITGLNNATGTALAEVYDLDSSTSAATTRLINLSARAQVGTGTNILIAGFVISGNVPKQLLIRGVGPKLTEFGVGGTLANPKLEVYNRDEVIVASNDDWSPTAELVSASNQVGAFALNQGSRDAALLVRLPPGSYTAVVSGVNSTTGVALVEVYEVQ